MGLRQFFDRLTISDRVTMQDAAADPTANGEIRRNGTEVKVFSGGSVRNLDETPSTTVIGTGDSPYTTQGEDVIYAGGGAITVTLASADVTNGNSIVIVNIDGAGDITVNTEGGETIDPGAAASKTISNAGWASRFTGDGTNWDQAAAAEFETASLADTLTMQDAAADPSANGEIQRNGADVKVQSGGATRNLSNVSGGALDTGTVTASGGSTPALDTTITNVGLTQTQAHDFVVYVDADPSFDADYAFNYRWGFQWDDANSEVDINLTVNWDTDPGGGNDVTLRWDVVPVD